MTLSITLTVTSYIYKSSAVADISDRLATIDKGRKVGAAVPFSVGELGSPSNTMWTGPRPTSVLSDIVIHPTVWPQYTNVTDRQTDRQRSDSIGRIPFYKRSPQNHRVVERCAHYSELKLSIFV